MERKIKQGRDERREREQKKDKKKREERQEICCSVAKVVLSDSAIPWTEAHPASPGRKRYIYEKIEVGN